MTYNEPTNWILTSLGTLFAAASFFWLRGIWRNGWLDCAVGLLLLGIIFLAAQALGLLNGVGLCIMAFGAATIIVGRFRKQISIRDVDTYGTLFFLLGLFLVLML
jgi:hypothetical protein